MKAAGDKHQDQDHEYSFVLAYLSALLYKNPGLYPSPSLNFDWEKFYRILLAEKLTGLFASITKTQPEMWPQSIQDRLQGVRYRLLLYHDWWIEHMKSTLSALDHLRIPIIVLKGWALMERVYDGDSSQRITSDIDLLIKPEDFARVTNFLHEQGYRDGMIEPWPGYYLRYISSIHYLSPHVHELTSQGLNIDLHWGVPEPPFYDHHIDVGELMNYAESLNTAGVEVKRFPIEEEIVYISAHIAHHGYRENLSRYYETASLIRKAIHTIDWTKVCYVASRWHVSLPLRRMIATLNDLWPESVPSEVAVSIEKLNTPRKDKITDHYLAKSRHPESTTLLLSILNIKQVSVKTRFFLETLFPNRYYMEKYFGPISGKIWPVLYVRRIARFVSG